MRYSHQRESIYHTVCQSHAHPTALMVYEALKGDMPRLSLGTVYRNLNQLSDAGRLKKIPLPDGSCRFDGTTHAHSHIVCQDCGCVADVTPPSIARLKTEVEDATKFSVSSVDLVLYGRCQLCHTGQASST